MAILATPTMLRASAVWPKLVNLIAVKVFYTLYFIFYLSYFNSSLRFPTPLLISSLRAVVMPLSLFVLKPGTLPPNQSQFYSYDNSLSPDGMPSHSYLCFSLFFLC